MLSSSDGPIAAPPSTADLVRKSAVFYGIASAVGLSVIHLGHESLARNLGAPTAMEEGLRWLAVGALAAGVLLVLSHFFEDWFPSFRDLKSAVVRLIGPVSVPAAIYLALVSSFGEELLFRGALQPLAGLWITSALFGLLHMGPGPLSAWSFWAMLAGLLLGWLFEATGSLWPAILAHFGVNAISILNLRRAWRSMEAHLEAEQGLAARRPPRSSARDDG